MMRLEFRTLVFKSFGHVNYPANSIVILQEKSRMFSTIKIKVFPTRNITYLKKIVIAYNIRHQIPK